MNNADEVSLYQVPALYDKMVVPGPCEAFYRKLADHLGGPILEISTLARVPWSIPPKVLPPSTQPPSQKR